MIYPSLPVHILTLLQERLPKGRMLTHAKLVLEPVPQDKLIFNVTLEVLTFGSVNGVFLSEHWRFGEGERFVKVSENCLSLTEAEFQELSDRLSKLEEDSDNKEDQT